jgi:feruloyl esterase
VIGTNNPNLNAFRKAGGKLLSWVGTTDQLIYPQGVMGYYQTVVNQQGLANTQQFYRFFIAPGAQHCGPGAGPAPTDPFDAMVNWVEQGVAPTSLAGSTVNSSGTTITRPVCLYPDVATYTGNGDVNDGANWACKPGNIPQMPSANQALKQGGLS